MNDDKARKQLRKHGLDLDSMSLNDIKHANAEDIRDMDLSTLGTGLYSFGSLFNGNSDTSMIMDLLKAQIRQQWIIVRQNEQIIRLLSEDGTGKRNSTKSEPDEQDKPLNMKLVRRIPAEPTAASSDHICSALTVDGCDLMDGNVVVARLAPRMMDILNKSVGDSGKVVLSEVNGKFATIDVYAES